MFKFDSRFDQNPPAIEVEIRIAESSLKIAFPNSYREFLLFANGGEGAIGADGYVALWPVQLIPTRWKQLNFASFAPRYVPIGSNGGSESFSIRFSRNDAVFGFIPFADLNDEAFIEISRDFSEAMNSIGAGRVFD